MGPGGWLVAVYVAPSVAVALALTALGGPRFRWLGLGALSMAGVVILWASQARYGNNQYQLEMIRWVRDTVADDETVMDGWTGFGVLRDHAYEYFFLHEAIQRLLGPRARSHDVIEILRERPPRLVAAPGQVARLSRQVAEFLEEHYRPAERGPFWEPRPPGDRSEVPSLVPPAPRTRAAPWLRRAEPPR